MPYRQLVLALLLGCTLLSTTHASLVYAQDEQSFVWTNKKIIPPFEGIDATHLVLTMESILLENDADYQSPEEQAATQQGRAAYLEALVKYTPALKRLRKLMGHSAMVTNQVNATIARELNLYASRAPERVKKLPNAHVLPNYGDVDRNLVVLQNLNGNTLAMQEKLRATKCFLYNKNAFNLLEYPSYDELMMTLESYATRYPNLARLIPYGTSHDGKLLMAMEISDHSVADWKKPVLEFDSLIHSDEVATLGVTMYMIPFLLSRYETDLEVRAWLRNFRIVVIPVFNPDGYHRVVLGDLHRKKNGYRQGNLWVGVNLNRNFPFGWDYPSPPGVDQHNPFSRNYVGPFAASEPETKAFMQFMRELRPLASINYHSEGETLLYPSAKNQSNVAEDLFKDIGTHITQNMVTDKGVIGGFTLGKAIILYGINPGGALLDWAWQELGTLSYVCEVVDFDNTPTPNQAALEKLAIRQAQGWQDLLRRATGPGFRAMLSPNSHKDLELVQYRIIPELGPEQDQDNSLSTKYFPVRNKEGLIYALTEPGSYIVEFRLDGRVLTSLIVDVAEGITDLGTIQLPLAKWEVWVSPKKKLDEQKKENTKKK